MFLLSGYYYKGENLKLMLKTDGFTPLLRCCQESPMAKDDPNESEAKKTEDKSNQDNFRAEIIKLLVGKGANMKAKGTFLPFFYEMT